jgi:hypothetical protein
MDLWVVVWLSDAMPSHSCSRFRRLSACMTNGLGYVPQQRAMLNSLGIS